MKLNTESFAGKNLPRILVTISWISNASGIIINKNYWSDENVF